MNQNNFYPKIQEIIWKDLWTLWRDFIELRSSLIMKHLKICDIYYKSDSLK